MGNDRFDFVIRLSNDFLMRIVLLSFLIGLVGKSLTKSNDNWALNRYKIQAEMNLLANVKFFEGSSTKILSAQMNNKKNKTIEEFQILKKEISDLRAEVQKFASKSEEKKIDN